MSLTSMPTGTVSRDGSGSRTYPRDGRDGSPVGDTSTAAAARADAARQRELDALRHENDALRKSNAHLRARLEDAHQRRQDVIDRYERLFEETSAEGATTTTERETGSRWQSAVDSPTDRAVRWVRATLTTAVRRLRG